MAGAKARNVLVLGAGYVGLMAALRLSRRAGSRARVTVVNGSDDFVERIRLHQERLEAHWGVSYRWLDGPEPAPRLTSSVAPRGSAEAEHA